MAYSQLYAHLIWSTYERRPQLTASTRDRVFRYLASLVKDTNAFPELINGVDDHVHLLVRLPTTLAVADLVRTVKSNSSRWRNEEMGHQALKWQTKYAAFSVNPLEIDIVKRYIANQEKHHGTVSFQTELRTTLDEHGIEYDERYIWE